MPRYNSEKNVARKYFAMKNTLIFCKDNFFKHMLPGYISENQFANRNRPTTCKIYENFVFAFHISMTDKMLDHHVMDNFLSPADLGCMNTFLSKFLVV